MSLEGLLAVAGIALAIHAIPQPVQRRSIGLFVPVWLLSVALGVAPLLVFSAQWVATCQCPVP